MKSKILWAVSLMVLAVIIVLNTVGINFGLNVALWKIALAFLVLVFVVERCIEGKFGYLFIPLVIIFLILEKDIALACGIESGDIGPNWLFIVSAVLITIGLEMLLPSERTIINVKGGTGRFRQDNALNGDDLEVEEPEDVDDVEEPEEPELEECDNEEIKESEKECKENFKEAFKNNENAYYNKGSSSTRYIDCATKRKVSCYNKLGNTEVYFTNTENFSGEIVFNVVNELGNVEIYVPKDWYISCDIINKLGNVDVEKINVSPNSKKRLIIKGHNKLGNVEVTYTK